MSFNCLKDTEPPRGDSLLLTTKSAEVPCTHWSKILEPPSCFKPGILELEIQRLNHQTIDP